MRLVRLISAAFMAAAMLASAARAQTIDAEVASVAAFEASAAEARASMMADPAGALEHARAAETAVDSLPTAGDRTSALVTAWWLQAEALVRLNKAREAAPIVQRALDRLDGQPHPTKLHADVLTAAGRIAKQTGDFGQSLSSTQRAYEIYRDLGERRSEAIALQSIGYIYFAARQYERVIAYFENASRVYPDDDALNLSAFNNVANALKQLGRHDEAVTYYERAYAIAERMGSGVLRARILNNIANLHVVMGRFDAADAAVEQALAGVTNPQAGDWVRFLWGVQAQAAFGLGEVARAEELFERTFADVALEETTQNFLEFHDAAARFYAELGDWRSAHAHQVAFKRLDDEGRDIAASANTALMSAQFDVTQKELRIEQLNGERLRQDVELTRSKARERMILAVGTALLLLAGLIAVAVRSQLLRKGRDAERALNTRLSSMNDDLMVAEDELRNALAQAQASARAKQSFLGNMNHELRTPLNAIIGFADVLGMEQHGPLGADEYRAYVDMIGDGGRNMLRVISTVMELTALDRAECLANAEAVAVGDVVEDAIAAQKGFANERGVRVDLDERDLDETIRIDERRVRQALEAVVENAVSFSPENGAVSVAARVDAEAASITVADRGAGMDADTLARVFAPFEKGDRALTSEHGGIGLGLTLAKAITEANAGTLTLSSTPGEGTTATFTFPRAAADAPLRHAA